MRKFTTHDGQAVSLAQANVDTDVIISASRITRHPREELGRWAFESIRHHPDGRVNPTCVLNDPACSNASILLAGQNFGCGSSREMAVWALVGMGIRCVIAPTFGDIFYANCFQNGLLPIKLASSAVQTLHEQAAQGPLHLQIDLQAQTLRGLRIDPLTFDIEPLRKQMLLNGKDEIDLVLAQGEAIASWQARDREIRPWVYARVPPDSSARRHP
jgi:3-isopropylmalate/(R)-2-methylmalate dehydratase small subunit